MNKTFAAFAILGMAAAINLNDDYEGVEPEHPEDNGLAQVSHVNHFSDGKCRSASGPSINMKIQNDTDEWVQIFWHDWNGNPVAYKVLQPNKSY